MNIRQAVFQPERAHVFMISFLLGLTAALLLGIDRVLASAEESLRSQLAVAVFFQSSEPDEAARRISESLRGRDSAIESAQFISKQAALQDAQQDPALARSLMVLKDNPLPASTILRYRDEAWLERGEPAETLRGVPQIQEIRWDARARSSFRSLHQWRAWLLRLAAFSCPLRHRC